MYIMLVRIEKESRHIYTISINLGYLYLLKSKVNLAVCSILALYSGSSLGLHRDNTVCCSSLKACCRLRRCDSLAWSTSISLRTWVNSIRISSSSLRYISTTPGGGWGASGLSTGCGTLSRVGVGLTL